MKTEFLTELGLEKEVIDKIMAENGKDINNAKESAENLSVERDALKAQLEEANAAIQSYKDMDIEGVKTAADEWKTKYETETAALQEQMKAKEYGFAVERLVDGVKFSSNAAKKAFLGDLTEKKLPLENEKLMGFDDFLAEYKKNDPGTFADEQETPPPYSAGTGNGAVNEEQDEFQKRINKYKK